MQIVKHFQVLVLQSLFFIAALISFPSFAEIKTETAFGPAMLLHNAIRAGQLDDVRMLIENKIDVNQVFKEGITPLHLSVISNQANIAAVLIQAGAKINAEDAGTKATPLHFAALYGRESLATLLINKGADVNAVMRFDITPLLVAAQFNQPQIAQLLLDKKADVKRADQEGFTALHFAAQNGNAIIADMLIKHKANINAKDKTNRATPLKIAVDNNHPEVIRLLEEYGAKE